MKKIMAANWKMYKTGEEAAQVAKELVQLATDLPKDRKVLVCPPFTAIKEVADAFRGVNNFSVGAQNVYPASEGAFTGELSPAMLRAAGADWVLTGHSERRTILRESNEFVGDKTAFALENELNVILCVGEQLKERENGLLSEVLSAQLTAGLAGVSKNIAAERIAVAYEPVWAIGTGKVAGAAEITEAHALIRALLKKIMPHIADETPILYGGSVKSDNASAIMALDNVDGVLVGGASLQAESFCRIICA